MLSIIRNKKGFTLVELVMAMGVFVILIGITAMVLVQCISSYQAVHNQSNYGAVTNNLVSTIRQKTANAYDMALLPMSDDYSSYLTFDKLCKNADTTVKDFKGRPTMDFEVLVCDADAGIKVKQISFTKAGVKTETETSQYTYENYKKAVPIIKFKRSGTTINSLFVDVTLYTYDSTYADDGTATYFDQIPNPLYTPTGTEPEFNYKERPTKFGMNTEISCVNSPTITSPVDNETYVRAIVYRILK